MSLRFNCFITIHFITIRNAINSCFVVDFEIKCQSNKIVLYTVTLNILKFYFSGLQALRYCQKAVLKNLMQLAKFFIDLN